MYASREVPTEIEYLRADSGRRSRRMRARVGAECMFQPTSLHEYQKAVSSDAFDEVRTSLPGIAKVESLRVSAHTREAHNRTREATCIHEQSRKVQHKATTTRKARVACDIYDGRITTAPAPLKCCALAPRCLSLL